MQCHTLPLALDLEVDIRYIMYILFLQDNTGLKIVDFQFNNLGAHFELVSFFSKYFIFMMR